MNSTHQPLQLINSPRSSSNNQPKIIIIMASQVAKSSTCCGKSDTCVCGKLYISHRHNMSAWPLESFANLQFQPSKPSVRADSNPPSTAHATRPPRRTQSPGPAALAARVPLASAPATELRPRTSSLPVTLAPVDPALLVSYDTFGVSDAGIPVLTGSSRCLHLREGR